MNKLELKLPVQEMTPVIMDKMEKEGLIIRICPSHHDIETPEGNTWFEELYEGKEEYGPHKIIAITVNRRDFPGFGTHPDQEEFWLVGNNEARPMYILIARMMREEFELKVKNHELKTEDFYLLHAKYNDPEVSFFTMISGVPHGEGVMDSNDTKGVCPSFYVTESRNLPLDLCSLGDYVISQLSR